MKVSDGDGRRERWRNEKENNNIIKKTMEVFGRN